MTSNADSALGDGLTAPKPVRGGAEPNALAWPLRALVGGLFLAAAEIAWVWQSRAWGLFLSSSERQIFALLSTLTTVTGVSAAFVVGLSVGRLSRDGAMVSHTTHIARACGDVCRSDHCEYVRSTESIRFNGPVRPSL